jgi:hypothetical protein
MRARLQWLAFASSVHFDMLALPWVALLSIELPVSFSSMHDSRMLVTLADGVQPSMASTPKRSDEFVEEPTHTTGPRPVEGPVPTWRSWRALSCSIHLRRAASIALSIVSAS